MSALGGHEGSPRRRSARASIVCLAAVASLMVATSFVACNAITGINGYETHDPTCPECFLDNCVGAMGACQADAVCRAGLGACITGCLRPNAPAGCLATCAPLFETSGKKGLEVGGCVANKCAAPCIKGQQLPPPDSGPPADASEPRPDASGDASGQ